ncbi:UNVERIFIED_CONTAM: hypothetical protein Slati_2117900 [Sesamum latifolium]|uniref:Retrotransposon Copia-like N-terminal domain-containing protein n=1 Tax=Sesamum latifolium TaxID=2727402 RepID=A0AAW2WQ48_9LAMI
MAGKYNEGSGTSTEEQKSSKWSENLRLYGGDNPGATLVYILLDGSNFLSWSRSVRLALGAKWKLGFIDGTCTKPVGNSDEIEQWECVDCMVVSWLLNSIQKDIAEAFIYTTSARNLWEELETRFGESTDVSDLIRLEIRRALQEQNHVEDYDTNLVDFEDYAEISDTEDYGSR